MLGGHGSGLHGSVRFLRWAAGSLLIGVSGYVGVAAMCEEARVRIHNGPAGTLPDGIERLARPVRVDPLAGPVLVVTDDSDDTLEWRVAFSPKRVFRIGVQEYARQEKNLIEKYPGSVILFVEKAPLIQAPASCQSVPLLTALGVRQCHGYKLSP